VTTLKMTLIFFEIIFGLGVIFFIIIYLRYFISLRPKENGFKYVSVESDGLVRELDEDEKEYLSADFDPADGARPYIKNRFKSLTPDVKLTGYIERRRVPKSIKIIDLEE
jgi:hypothetical protein